MNKIAFTLTSLLVKSLYDKGIYDKVTHFYEALCGLLE